VVQAKTDSEGGEVTSAQIWSVFQDEYLPAPVERAEDKWGRFELTSTRTSSDLGGSVSLQVELRDGDEVRQAEASGNGPIAAFLQVLADQGVDVRLLDYVEHALSASGDARAASYVELEVEGVRLWGVGIDEDSSTASLEAIVSGVNRAIRRGVRAPELAGV